MENLAIARIFAEIADLLEIKGENPFKIRAYRNAADTIEHATERLAVLHRRAASRDAGYRQRSRGEDSRDRRNRRRAISPRAARAVPVRRFSICSTFKASARRRSLSCTRSSAFAPSTSSKPPAGTDGIRDTQRDGLEERAADPEGLRRAEAALPDGIFFRTPPPQPSCCSTTCAPSVRRRRSSRLAAYAAAPRPQAISTSLRPAADPQVMPAFTAYKLVDRVLVQGGHKIERAALRAAFRRIFAWFLPKARAPRCSILRAPSPTTLRFAIGRSRAVSN